MNKYIYINITQEDINLATDAKFIFSPVYFAMQRELISIQEGRNFIIKTYSKKLHAQMRDNNFIAGKYRVYIQSFK